MAINNCVFMGRICNDLELKQTQSGKHVLSFTLAVDSSFKQQDGTYKTNFINFGAWEQKADFSSRYFKKGSLIAITGELNQRTYQGQDGKNHSVYEVFVSQVSFAGEKKDDNGGNYQQSKPNNAQQPQENLGDFEEVIGGGDLPF